MSNWADVAIGPGCVIEAGVRLSRCTVMRGVRIKKHACISGSIIGWHSIVGQWARVESMTILGEDVHVCDEIYSNGGVVLPHRDQIQYLESRDSHVRGYRTEERQSLYKLYSRLEYFDLIIPSSCFLCWNC